MRRLLREPLLHFLLGGAALFALYVQITGDWNADRSDRIVVRPERVASLAATFQRTWMRPPTENELTGLIDDYVIEEVLYREALALDLDRDDLVVRRRMRQKMEFLYDGLTDATEPAEEELRTFLAENPERFQIPARWGFTQIFFDPNHPGSGAEARAAAVLRRLESAGDGAMDVATLGDATLLPAGLRSATRADVAATFGERFAETLAGAAHGTWTGPIASTFGLHLVRVGAHTPAQLPELAAVRERVAREWAADRREQARHQFHRDLRARYQVEIHMPAARDVAGGGRSG